MFPRLPSLYLQSAGTIRPQPLLGWGGGEQARLVFFHLYFFIEKWRNKCAFVQSMSIEMIIPSLLMLALYPW